VWIFLLKRINGMLNREEVYKALDSERDYQDLRWNEKTTSTKGKHSVAEFVLFMEDYLAEARKFLSRNPEPEASELALANVRKIAAMGVACMEQNGAPMRVLPVICPGPMPQ
jgi:hypothetical protein